MEQTVYYQIAPADLRTFFEEEYAKKNENASRDALLRRFDDVFVGVSEIAVFHKVSIQTVRNYIRDGLLKPELRTVEHGKFKFRLSYVLLLDFSMLKTQLKEKKYK
jgi:hypothetical protein